MPKQIQNSGIKPCIVSTILGVTDNYARKVLIMAAGFFLAMEVSGRDGPGKEAPDDAMINNTRAELVSTFTSEVIRIDGIADPAWSNAKASA